MKKLKQNSTSLPNVSNTRPFNIVLATLSLIPLYLLFSLIKEYSLNLPFLDDYDAILNFLNSWDNSNNKIELLFSQHNEHRIFSSKIIYLLYYFLFHKINFLVIIILGNLQLLSIAGLLSYFSIKFLDKNWGIAMLIISICLFDPSNYDNNNFAMAGMQNYGVVLFFLASLFFYTKTLENKYAIFWSVFFQFLCAFSSGSGIIGGFILVLFNLIYGNKKSLITSVVSFIVFTSAYFYSYHSAPSTLTGKSIGDAIYFFLNLSGSHFGYEDRVVISILSICILIFLSFFKRGLLFEKKIGAIFALLAFIILSMGTASLFRSGGKEGIEHDSYASRYLIYPHLFTALIFLLLCYKLKEYKYNRIILLTLSLLFIKAYKSNYEYGENGFARTNYRLLNLVQSESGLSNTGYRLSNTNYYYPDSNFAKKIAIESCQKGIYCIEENRNP